jgi:HD-like signal output (HDOD) protein
VSAALPAQAVAAWPADAQITAAARGLGVVGRSGLMLWRELSDPKVDFARLDRALREDPAIAARVLKVANSAYYQRGRTVSSIEQALMVLGTDAVRGIAASAGLDRIASRSPQAVPYIRHSIATASIAADLAGDVDSERRSEAFLAGLLHDLGLLIVWRLVPDAVDSAARAADLHVHCGRLALDAWQLPSRIVAAVGAHHSAAPDAVGADLVVSAVRVAEWTAATGGLGCADDGPAPAPCASPGDLAVLGLDDATWPTARERALARATAMVESLAA